jgi:hypothetical protein
MQNQKCFSECFVKSLTNSSLVDKNATHEERVNHLKNEFREQMHRKISDAFLKDSENNKQKKSLNHMLEIFNKYCEKNDPVDEYLESVYDNCMENYNLIIDNTMCDLGKKLHD